jgi:hypothetical protein
MLSLGHNSKLKPPPSYRAPSPPLKPEASRRLERRKKPPQAQRAVSWPKKLRRVPINTVENSGLQEDQPERGTGEGVSRIEQENSRRGGIDLDGGGAGWSSGEREEKVSLARRWNGALAERKSGRVWNVNSFGFALFTFSPSFLIKLM